MTVGDIACNKSSNYTIAKILKNVGKVDRFVFLGDIDYGPAPESGGSYLKCGKDFLKKISDKTELLIVRGNHENDSIWNDIPGTKGIWSEKIGNILLVGLDSEIPFKDQYNNISAVLDKKADHKLIFIHKPVLPEVCQGTIETATMCGFYELYSPMFVKKGVDCVIQAHIHTMAIFEKNGICYPIYGTGGAGHFGDKGAYLQNKLYESRTWGYTIIDIKGDKETHTFYSNNGTKIKFVYKD